MSYFFYRRRSELSKCAKKTSVQKSVQSNKIEQKIKIEKAACTIQNCVRTYQARNRVQVLRDDRKRHISEIEEYILRGDLPSDHAVTMRVEG